MHSEPSQETEATSSLAGQLSVDEKTRPSESTVEIEDEDFDFGLPGPFRSNLRKILEWVAVIGTAFIVAFVIKAFLFQAYYIPSPSMEPSLGIGDRVIVNKLSYKLHDVNRGDMIVFDNPKKESCINHEYKKVAIEEVFSDLSLTKILTQTKNMYFYKKIYPI